MYNLLNYGTTGAWNASTSKYFSVVLGANVVLLDAVSLVGG